MELNENAIRMCVRLEKIYTNHYRWMRVKHPDIYKFMTNNGTVDTYFRYGQATVNTVIQDYYNYFGF